MDEIAEEYPFRPNYIMTGGGLRMHYVDEGQGSVILFLHACPMWSFFFRRLIRALSGKYRVVAPDHVGYGLSDKPGDYDYRLDSHVDNLERLVEQLGIRKMTLVMHGWGATIGCAYAVRHPGRIANLIVMNSMAFTGYSLPLRLKFYRAWPWLARRFFFYRNMMFSGMEKLSRSVRAGYMLPYQNERDRIAILKFISELPCHPEDRSYESIVGIEHGFPFLRDCPTCIIWASDDWLYPERYLCVWLRFCPGAKVFRIPGTGRYVAEEAPDQLLSAVTTFLDSVKDKK